MTDRNQARMLTGAIYAVVAVVAWLSVIWFPAHARELYAGQFDDVDPATRAWFKGVKSKNGVPCCDMSDGHPTDFKVDEGGHYFVPIADVPNGPNPVWILVPPEAVITSQGNPNDRAYVWYVKQGQQDGQPRFFIRCFVPVGGV